MKKGPISSRKMSAKELEQAIDHVAGNMRKLAAGNPGAVRLLRQTSVILEEVWMERQANRGAR